MEQYAIIMGETFLSWNALILTAAAAVSICFFLAFYLGKTGLSTGTAGRTAMKASGLP